MPSADNAPHDTLLPLQAIAAAATDNALPDWALVLSTYRRRDVLMLCLQAALGQTRPPAEIVVVDASVDWHVTRDAVMSEIAPAKPGVRWHYVEAERRSLPAQRNQGIALSTAPILFMIDDDSLMYPDCAEQILRIYAADAKRQVAGVGAAEAVTPPLLNTLNQEDHAGFGAECDDRDAADHANSEPSSLDRLRARLRWNVATLFDRGPESFLPYQGRWDDRPLPPELAHLDCSPARALNGFRMTFRREVIAKERFLSWFVGYAPLEDLDASHRASRHGLLVNSHTGRLCHLTHPSARPNHFAVAAQWVMSNAVLQAVFGDDRPALARAWSRRVKRFVLLELIKDLAKGRMSLPNFRGMLHGARRLREIYSMTPEQLQKWYPPVQATLMGVPLPKAS